METSGDNSNCLGTSISEASEAADSLSSFQSALTPGSTLAAEADQQSDDQSFDTISRQKLNLTSSDLPERVSLAKPPISMFEEDTRSSWSVDPCKQTPFKETALDEDSQSSAPISSTIHEDTEKEKATIKGNILDTSQAIVSDQVLNKDIQPDKDSPLSEQMTFKRSELFDDSENSVRINTIFEEPNDDSRNSANKSGSFKIDGDYQNSSKEIVRFKVDNDEPHNSANENVSFNKIADSQISVKEVSCYKADNESHNSINDDASFKEIKEGSENSVNEVTSFKEVKEDSETDVKTGTGFKGLDDDSKNSIDNSISFKNSNDDLRKGAHEVNNVTEADNNSSKEASKVINFKEISEDSQKSINKETDSKDAYNSKNSASKETSFKNLVNDDSQNSIIKEAPDKNEDSQMDIDIHSVLKGLLPDEDSQVDGSTLFSVEPKLLPFKETSLDEDSRQSVSSQKSSSKLQSVEVGVKDQQTFPPEKLIEYMWPQEKGEFFILQEQICDYLNIKSFKRKYPDLVRRPVEIDERNYLKEKAIVTEVQCDLGLTALRSEEVLELMSRDYPDHYKEYIRVLREKEQQSITDKHREFAATNSDKTKMVDLVKKAVQSAAEYNAHLNQERREERRSCMDLQTFTIHYPVKTSSKPKATVKPGKYPVALLPGQYQDYYKEYTSDELKYLPVNTVLYGPLKELQSVQAASDGSQSDSDDSTGSDGSCSSSQGTQDDSSSGSEKTDTKNGIVTDNGYKPKVKPNAICKMCKKGPEGKSEELVHCSECENSAHPSCIELTTDVVEVLRTYPWQCMDCKVCSHCTDPNNEDKMLFCDICDRGYHTFCVGLKSLPQGKWVCRRCGACSVCAATQPGPESSKAQWQYEVVKGAIDVDTNRRPKIMCQSCFKKKR